MTTFTKSYITCALWASRDDNDVPLDTNYSPTDLSVGALKRICDDCQRFQETNALDLPFAYTFADYGEEQAGHDFWLTRNRHGTGFWDSELGPVGDRLTNAAHAFGECDLYVGDDGKLHTC